LGAARTRLEALLEAAVGTGATVTGYVPEELDDIAVVIQSAPNAIEPVQTYLNGTRAWVGTFEVCLLISGETNERVQDLVDDHLSAIAIALANSGTWEVVEGSISSIQTFRTSNWQAYGVNLLAACELDPQE
jgi:hypothetical protein